MRKIKPWKVAIFVVAFAVFAWLLNHGKVFSKQHSNDQQLMTNLVSSMPHQVGDKVTVEEFDLPLTLQWSQDVMLRVPVGCEFRRTIYGAWVEEKGIGATNSFDIIQAPIGTSGQQQIDIEAATLQFRIADDQHGLIVEKPHVHIRIYRTVK